MASTLPDFDKTFVSDKDIAAFERAIAAPDVTDDDDHHDHFITALHDWRPINQTISRGRTTRLRRGGEHRQHQQRRGKDETREGYSYALLKWPMLALAFTWIFVLSVLYVLTRFYISEYEHWITWRGRRNLLRKKLQNAKSYNEWMKAAQELDWYLGAETWKSEDEFAYYDYSTVGRIVKDLKRVRERAEAEDKGATEMNGGRDGGRGAGADKKHDLAGKAVEELRSLLEMCVKNNFAGVESSWLYSQTYYGTKNLVQNYVNEVEKSLQFICETHSLPLEEKRDMFKHISSNYGKTALCLSGGASFSYYHFGVVKAHLDAGLLPNIISGTSGGALVAALACTRTDCELKELLVPELSEKITACHDDVFTWIKRWYRTGARFDSVDWARRCCWFTRGSMTFKEAFNRTGRVLNISCIPSDPHSPSLLLNHLTAPDCCIFSAVLASAAVPGILNPVVLMTRTRNGTIAPYSFGNKWKDGSLRTDIPLRALNLRFNANFSIVSQVNPHVNIFFFASRGAVGRPVTHRRGKGWRGGFLGSALEQYLKLDLAKWLKVTRHLELLPRPLEQDWSGVFLQKFDGTITLWPKTSLIDFWYILSDPSRERLSRMLDRGQAATWPKLKFVANRLRIERAVEQGRQLTRISKSDSGDVSQSQTLDSPPPQNPPHGLSEGLTVARAEENKREFTSWSSWLSSLKLEPQGGIGEGHGNKVYIEDSTTSCSGDEGDGDDEDEGDSDIDARIDNDVGSGGEILFMNGDSQGNDDGKIQKPVEKFEARSETVLGG